MPENRTESAPPEKTGRGERQRPAPLGFTGTVRFLWGQLTSMRTALVLLFAGALAAIPGSLVPQRNVSPVGVDDFIAEHPKLGPIYDTIGMFEVYTSPWFSAIYLLLLVSLVGCILPRLRVYWRALRSAPPRTPRNLVRLPTHARTSSGESPDAVLAAATARLRTQRYRVARNDDSVSAERGYLREAGNLVFHLSLVVALLGIAIGITGGYRGNAIVVVGNGFANTLSQYDDITAGTRFSDTDLNPFSVVVNDFRAEFETGPVQTGAARVFEADVQVTEAPGEEPYERTLEVNKPLNIDGTVVHLIAHGYAPTVTVTDANGDVAWSGPVVFLPQDGNFTSAGAIKAHDARPERLAFQGFFLPTAVVDDQGPRSVFPDAVSPELFLTAWYGDPKTETGEPENVYTLDTSGLTQFAGEGGDKLRFRMAEGEVFDLPDGKGSITFDGYQRWVKLQLSHQPGLGLTLGAIGAAVLGLCLSLFVRPRRVWVRATTGRDGSTVVTIAGLDRADARTGLDEQVNDLAAELGGGAGSSDSSEQDAHAAQQGESDGE